MFSVASKEQFEFFVFVELSPGADALLIDGKSCMVGLQYITVHSEL